MTRNPLRLLTVSWVAAILVAAALLSYLLSFLPDDWHPPDLVILRIEHRAASASGAE